MTKWVIFLYGLIVLILGYVGYAKGGSLISFYMGAGFGTLLMLSAGLAKRRWSVYVALALTCALSVTLALRTAATHKELPAILAVLSGAMLVFLLIRVVRWHK